MKPFFIGSLPHGSVESAIAFVKANSPDLPFLPQLPGLNPQEDMIGQVLRGFEIGAWDDKASICLAAFWREFAGAPRAKIQIAGPEAVARTMCMNIHEVLPQWNAMFEGVTAEWESAKMRGEAWFQIDEPYWNQENKLSDVYPRFLKGLKEIFPAAKFGIHSCAVPRQAMDMAIFPLCDFFAFDCSRAFTSDERKFWEANPQKLVAGVLTKDRPADLSRLPAGVEWVSATCGLADWSEDEIATITNVNLASPNEVVPGIEV